MSTHRAQCVVCQADTFCSNDEHVLGVGGCSDPHPIEFCSLECFTFLRAALDERLQIAKELYPAWFTAVETAA